MYSNEKTEVIGHQKIGRPKLSDAIRKDMKEKQVKIEEVQNRRTWTLKTLYANPKLGEGRGRRYHKSLIIDHYLL